MKSRFTEHKNSVEETAENAEIFVRVTDQTYKDKAFWDR